MTSTKGTPKGTGDAEATRIVSLTALADRVEELAGQIVSGAKAPGKSANVSRESSAGGSLDDQVTRAVADAREKEKAQSAAEAERKATEDRIKALEDRTEKRPTERSKLSRWLWGEE